MSSTTSQVLSFSNLVGELCLLVKHVIVITNEKATDILGIWGVQDEREKNGRLYKIGRFFFKGCHGVREWDAG